LKILILTQYFPPEVGAPQNRLFELAVRLQKKGEHITILTAMPNYPKMEIHPEYKGKWHVVEEMEGMEVHRSWIYVSKGKSFVKRLLNYFSFVFSSMLVGTFSLGKFDYILCESPPLFLGISAYILKVFKRSKLIFNVSDLWPESAIILGFVKNKLLLWVSLKLEEFLYRKSEIITGQTQGIVKNISTRFPGKRVYWLPNGVDLSYYSAQDHHVNWRSENGYQQDDFVLLYAGLIGYAQGLEVILNAAEQVKIAGNEKFRFVIMGNGPEKPRLMAIAAEKQLTNVHFFETVGKKQMPAVINAVDVAIVPLKKRDLFKGAIPSKIFETLAMKKPLLLGVEGEALDLFIKEGNAGLAFEPENPEELVNCINSLANSRSLLLQLGENGYNYVQKKFTRDRIADEFWAYIQ
jgi:glycosyltransferase involved in cell wall biosynthesis